VNNNYFKTKYRVDWPYEVTLSTESAFTFLPYDIFRYWGGALKGFVEETGRDIDFDFAIKGDYFFL